MLFSAENGTALWASDGTEAGTGLVSAFLPTQRGGGFFYGSAVGAGARAFATVVESDDYGLYVTDGTAGTAAGTSYVGRFNISSTDLSITPFGPGLLFASSEGPGGSGPYSVRLTDGTAAGTRRVTPDLDLQGFPRLEKVVTLAGGDAYVSANEGGALALWRVRPDGTSGVALRLPPAETLVLRTGYFDVARERRASQPVAVGGGAIYVLASRSTPVNTAYEVVYSLWRGQPGGAELVASYGPTDLNLAPQMVEAGGRVYVTFSSAATGLELFTLGRTAVAGEPAPGAGTLALGPPSPNPASGRTTFVLTSAEPVRVEAFDALGRRVAVLHDRSATGETVTFDTAGLPAGVYAVRARTTADNRGRRDAPRRRAPVARLVSYAAAVASIAASHARTTGVSSSGMNDPATSAS